MNETLAAITNEFNLLQSGLSGLLGRLQTVNARLREAIAHVETIARQVESVAPLTAPAPAAIMEPEILILTPVDHPHDLNGHATAPGSQLGERNREEATHPLPEVNGAPRASQTKPWLPKTWEEVRGLKGEKMERVLNRLGLPIERGKGSAMRNCSAVWERVQNG